jgi:hypothetical protein
MQKELTQTSPLLTVTGDLTQVGWARQPLLDCNLESAYFYKLKIFQKLRIKRWDYYAIFSSNVFFSATIADLGYAGNIFVYFMDLLTGDLHEESIVVPFGKGVDLPRNSTEGDSHFDNGKVRLFFEMHTDYRHLLINWPGFNNGVGIEADLNLSCPPGFESMNIVIPIGNKRFYYNRKINCLPVQGKVRYGDVINDFDPKTCLGSLDWGRGVWEYQSYWNWASASGFLPGQRTIGLNLGGGFGDLSLAGENAIILENKIHKLESVKIEYISGDYMQPWRFTDSEGRLNLIFTPFKDRTARTNLGIITSEVHQMFGKYNGEVISDFGEIILIKDLVGFAEEHHAKW